MSEVPSIIYKGRLQTVYAGQTTTGRCRLANDRDTAGTTVWQKAEAIIQRKADGERLPANYFKKLTDTAVFRIRASDYRFLWIDAGPGRAVVTHGFERKDCDYDAEARRALAIKAATVRQLEDGR